MSSVTTAVGLLVSFISIPLTVGYLGPERYGVWITISSVLTWIAIADIGIGSVALINAVSEARGRDDTSTIRSLISTALISMVIIACLLSGLFALVFPHVPWDRLLNAGGQVPSSELLLAVALAFIGFALLFPLGVANAVYAGLQEGYIGQCWNLLGHLGTLGALLWVTRYKGGLPELVLALTAVRLAVMAAGMTFLFVRRYPELAPSWRAASWSSFQRLFGLGWKYLIQQLANIGMFQSQPMLITQLAGSTAVGIYNIAFRIISIPQVLATLFLMPLVPAYGEARARGDWPWIWRMLARSMAFSTGIGILLSIPLVLLTGPAVRAWVSPDLEPGHELLMLLAAYTICTNAVAPIAVFFNGIERVGSMAAIGVANALVTIGLALLWLPQFGLVGMGYAMLAGYFVINVVAQLWLACMVYRGYLRSRRT